MTFDVTAPSCSVSDRRPEAGNAVEAEKIKLTYCGLLKELPTGLRKSSQCPETAPYYVVESILRHYAKWAFQQGEGHSCGFLWAL